MTKFVRNCGVTTAAQLGAIALIAFALLTFATGCSGASTTTSTTTTSTTATETTDDSGDTSSTTADDTNDEAEGAYDFSYTDRDQDPSYDEDSATKIALSGSSATVDGEGATAEDGTVTITDEGTYILSGSFTGQVVVAPTSDDVKVQVVLDGVDITNQDGPCILIEGSDKTFITLAEGSSNSLTDGSTHTTVTDDDGEENDLNAVIYSKDDLTLNGSGSLTINAKYMDGINSKDDLVITGGTYTVTAVDDCLCGKDCVKILDGTFNLEAGGDGIKSSNYDDEGRGFITIDGGTFTINAGDDGIQSAQYLRVMDGTVGINSTDDAIHCNVEALIGGGDITIAAGDDGVHAETVLTIADGTVNITSCYEGYEAQEVYVNGGDSTIVATDDGVNAAAAEVDTGEDEGESTNEAQANGGQPMGGMTDGATMGMGNSDCVIYINGGTLNVDAQGDGLDSNGSIYVTGGTTVVTGPDNSANAAFDYDLEATVSGGTLIAIGATGMAQNFTSGEQPFALINANGSAGSQVTVTDADGNVLASATATRSFGCVLVTSGDMEEGGTYTLSVNGSTTDFTASTTATNGMGGLGVDGQGMGAGQAGDQQMGDGPQGGMSSGRGQGDPNMGGGQGGGQAPGGQAI